MPDLLHVRRRIFALIGVIIVMALVLTSLTIASVFSDLPARVTRQIRDNLYILAAIPALILLGLYFYIRGIIQAFDRALQAATRQESELTRRVEQLGQLQQASLALARNVDLQQVLDRVCKAARDITASDTVTLLLYDPDDDTFTRASQWGYDAPLGKSDRIRSHGMTRAVLASGTPMLVQDAREHPLVNPAVVESGIRSIIAAPVISRKQTMGVLYVNSRQPNAYDANDVKVVTALSSQAAAALDNTRLLNEAMTSAQALEQRARNLLLINRISSDLTALLDPYEIFRATARHMVQLMQIDHCSILSIEAGAHEGIVVAEYPAIGTVGQRVPRTHNPAIDRVVTTRQMLAVPDIREEALVAPVRSALEEAGVRAVLIVPLVARDRVIGTINLNVLHQSHEFTREEQELCRIVAAQAAIAVSNARLLYDLRQQSRALSRKSQELAEESARLDAILTHMADGLVVTDLAGRIILSNPAFRSIAGLPADQPLRGRLLNDTFSIAALRQVIARAQTHPSQVALEDLQLADGRVLQATASALRARQGLEGQTDDVTGVVTVLRDITHEVEVDRMKTDFISTVSHELRTPLTSVLGFASLIQREFQRHISPLTVNDPDIRRVADRILENLGIIEAESQRLTRLINDVLDIAKMESGRTDWNMTEVNLTQVVSDAIKATRALAQEKGLPVQVALPPQMPLVWGDHDRLIQVMTNLLSNAIKFTKRGDITVRGWLWTDDTNRPEIAHIPPEASPPAIIIGVSDTGIGISEADMPLVFERFRQVGDTLTDKPTGTGLGLPICREIIGHHGGTIWVQSTLGLGSTFFFTVPLHTEPAALLADTPSIPVAETEAPARRSLLVRDGAPVILIVDDEPYIRGLLRQELAAAGYQTVEATDGDTALDLARSLHPDLIILDILMPGASGFGVTRALRGYPDTANTPIVIVSVADEAVEALTLGANAWLPKPVDVDRLLGVIEEMLRPAGQDTSKSYTSEESNEK